MPDLAPRFAAARGAGYVRDRFFGRELGIGPAVLIALLSMISRRILVFYGEGGRRGYNRWRLYLKPVATPRNFVKFS